MTLPALYLVTLILAPQLWLEPFVGLRVDYYLYPLWLAVLFFTAKVQRIRFGAQEIFFILWIVWMSVSVVVKGDLDRSENLLIDYVKWFILFLFVQASLDAETSIKRTVLFLVFLSAVLGVEGIQHYRNDVGWAGQPLGWVSEGAKGRTRWVGIFDGPGVFCVVYTIALPFAIHYYDTAKKVLHKWSAILTIGLLAVAIFYNGSRGGFLTALFVLVGYMYAKSKSKKAIVYGAVIVTVLLMIAPSYMTNLSDRQHSSSHRVEMWAEGCDMFKANPILGVGRGSFAQHSGSLIAHNSFVEIMAETGFFGLFFWIGLIYSNLKGLVAAYGATQEGVRTLALPLLLSILGYLVSALFVTLEYETLYFLLAVSAAFSRQAGTDAPFEVKDIVKVAAIAIGFIICINVFVLFIGPSAFH